MNSRFWLRSLQTAAVSASVLAAYPSQAAIMGWSIQGGLITEPENQTNLSLNFLDPTQDVSIIGFERRNEDGNLEYFLNPDPNRDILALVEKQSVALSENLGVFSKFDQSNRRPDLTLAPETLVSSYLFYVNPPGSTGRGNPRYVWTGEITFDKPILGIIGGFASPIARSNPLVALDNIEYEIRSAIDPGDDVVSFDGNVLSFRITSRTGTEPFRVITDGTPVVQAVPEPLTLLGSVSAIGFGTWFRKIRAKRETKGR